MKFKNAWRFESDERRVSVEQMAERLVFVATQTRIPPYWRFSDGNTKRRLGAMLPAAPGAVPSAPSHPAYQVPHRGRVGLVVYECLQPPIQRTRPVQPPAPRCPAAGHGGCSLPFSVPGRLQPPAPRCPAAGRGGCSLAFNGDRQAATTRIYPSWRLHLHSFPSRVPCNAADLSASSPDHGALPADRGGSPRDVSRAAFWRAVWRSPGQRCGAGARRPHVRACAACRVPDLLASHSGSDGHLRAAGEPAA